MSGLHSREFGMKEGLSSYAKPQKEERTRENSLAHCMQCFRETKQEVTRYKGMSTMTCLACGRQEENWL